MTGQREGDSTIFFKAMIEVLDVTNRLGIAMYAAAGLPSDIDIESIRIPVRATPAAADAARRLIAAAKELSAEMQRLRQAYEDSGAGPGAYASMS